MAMMLQYIYQFISYLLVAKLRLKQGQFENI